MVRIFEGKGGWLSREDAGYGCSVANRQMQSFNKICFFPNQRQCNTFKGQKENF